MTLSVFELAATAYEAYAQARHWRGFNGTPMPKWVELSPESSAGWVAAVIAVREQLETARLAAGE